MQLVTKKELKELVGAPRSYRIQDKNVDMVNQILSEEDTPLKHKAGTDLLLRNFVDYIQFLSGGRGLSDYTRAIKFVTYTEYVKTVIKEAHSYTFPETYHVNSPLTTHSLGHAPYAYKKSKLVREITEASLEELSTQYRPKRVELLDELHNIGLDVDVKPGTRINAIDSFLKHTTKLVDTSPKVDININNETHIHEAEELDYSKMLIALANSAEIMKQQLANKSTTVEDLGRLSIEH